MEKVAVKKKKPGRPGKAIKKNQGSSPFYQALAFYHQRKISAGRNEAFCLYPAGSYLEESFEAAYSRASIFYPAVAGMSNNINEVAKVCQVGT